MKILLFRTTVGAGAVLAVAASTACLPSAVGAAAANNLVTNPGFERDITGWAVTDASSAALKRVQGGHSGSYAGRISTSGAASPALNDLPSNFVTRTTPGTT